MQRKYKLTEAEYSAVKEEMRAIMIEVAKARDTITYSELALRLSVHIHYHSFLMARLLNEIGNEEIQAGRGVLPAVVVRKSSGIPGGGYFNGISHTHDNLDDLEVWWRDDLEALYDYWADQ